ncbi:MAG: NAD(P)-binding domain-containing protein [Eggerthellaceae bacterium]|jgi:3-hydroxyisobutyrate dehydrogenase
MAQSFAFYGDSVIGQVISENLQSAGFPLADSMEQADAVFTYCLTQQQLEDAYWETDGILSKAKRDCCLVDLSPSTPSFAKELYSLARVSELQALDAPLTVKDITSTHAFSDAGNLTILVGGEGEIIDRMMPMLTTIAQTVRPMGVPGNGQLAKVAQTIQLSAQLVALVESHAICKANQESAQNAVDAAVGDGLVSPQLSRLCAAIESRDFQGTYTSQVLLSELQAVTNASEDTDVVLPQSEACLRLVELFLVVGGTDLNATALGLMYADKDECDRYHLDWSRAESLYSQSDDDEGSDGGGNRDDFDDYDEDGDFLGGLGSFSSN